MHWEVGWMYNEPKSVDSADKYFFFCDGTPHMGWITPILGGQPCRYYYCFAVVAAADVNTCPSVWIYRKWYAVPPQYPPKANTKNFAPSCKGN